MTREQHRKAAEQLLDKAADYAPAHPERSDVLRRATVHALLALGNDPVVNTIVVNAPELADATPTEGEPAPESAPPTPPKPATRKRAASPRKTTPKETRK